MHAKSQEEIFRGDILMVVLVLITGKWVVRRGNQGNHSSASWCLGSPFVVKYSRDCRYFALTQWKIKVPGPFPYASALTNYKRKLKLYIYIQTEAMLSWWGDEVSEVGKSWIFFSANLKNKKCRKSKTSDPARFCWKQKPRHTTEPTKKQTP